MGAQSAGLLMILSLTLLINSACSFSNFGVFPILKNTSPRHYSPLQTRLQTPSPSPLPLRSPGSILRRGISSSSSLSVETENGQDPEYPWSFTGRLWFRPSLVRVPSTDGANPPPTPPPSVSIVSLFGWTLGGTVALEYDDSPVGPYLEYVTMGALVTKRGALGQWGSRLYVSTREAADVCRDTWNVPAQLADIEFTAREGGVSSSLSVESAPDSIIEDGVQKIVVGGWENTKVLDRNGASKGNRLGGLPVLWTPSIKALWAPFVLFPSGDGNDNSLPLHRLRLSASALRLKFCGQNPSDALGIPIGVGLVIDDVLIEIARQDGDL